MFLICILIYLYYYRFSSLNSKKINMAQNQEVLRFSVKAIACYSFFFLNYMQLDQSHKLLFNFNTTP